MTRPVRIEGDLDRSGPHQGGRATPAFLMWVISIAMTEPIAFPIFVGLIAGALMDSMSGFVGGVAVGFAVRLGLLAVRSDDGLP